MTDETDVALTFNDRINEHDLDGLTDLMTDDHTFVDSEDGVVDGRSACREAWWGFFNEYPDYRNNFASATSAGEVVTITGRSECSDPLLAGPALWRAVVRDGLVAEWRVFDDSPASRAELGLAAEQT